VGHTRDEYSLFTAQPGNEVTDEQFGATLDRLAPAADGTGGYRDAYPEATPGELDELVNSDWLFRMPSLHLAHAQHAGGGAAWTYELCWGFDRQRGASHSLDVLLVFGTLGVEDVRSDRSARPNAADEVARVSHQMRADWARFAGHRKPGLGTVRSDHTNHAHLRRRPRHRALPRRMLAPNLVQPPVRHP
jgi:para-nitrobenzyl esterase